jgi:quercetin dioxygenase-like cupin family protein
MKTITVTGSETLEVLSILGLTVEFLTAPSVTQYCVLKGTIPPGVAVPIHSHPDDESSFLLSGSVQSLREDGTRLEWFDMQIGEFIHVPGGAKHAWRNRSSEPAVQLITTTAKLGRFFREVGHPVWPGLAYEAPTAEEVQRFARLASQYGHWLASVEENIRAGIHLEERNGSN